MKVLIVDDTRSALLLSSAIVGKAGHQVVTAGNGAEAVAVYAREHPDLVLMDVVMPVMDGYAAAREIRARDGNQIWVPIVFLTGMNGDDDLAAGVEAGGDDYLIKPVSPVALMAKIKAMQRIADMRQELLVTTLQLSEANRKLSELSLRDGLTGVGNRRSFDETLAREWRRATRDNRPIALLLVDVDQFKLYNDHCGHQAGDDCLKRVAQSLSIAVKRPGDLTARYGGEEFGIILPATPREGALCVAESARSLVVQMAIPHPASAAGIVSVSIGVAAACPARGSDPSGLVAAADKALYAAKRGGRNRVVSMAWEHDVPASEGINQ